MQSSAFQIYYYCNLAWVLHKADSNDHDSQYLFVEKAHHLRGIRSIKFHHLSSIHHLQYDKHPQKFHHRLKKTDIFLSLCKTISNSIGFEWRGVASKILSALLEGETLCELTYLKSPSLLSGTWMDFNTVIERKQQNGPRV